MIQLVPAIDIIDGKCVRLTMGDYSRQKTYGDSPADMAKAFEQCGVKRLHLVDLDGAKISSPANLRTLEKVAKAVDCQIEWGGGLSSSEALVSVFNAGATHAIVGSIAALNPDMFEQWLDIHKDKMIFGADIKNGEIAVKGWVESVKASIREFAQRFAAHGLQEMICTDIRKDGMLQGPDPEFYKTIGENIKETGIQLTASGGVSSMKDIEMLDSLNLRKVIVGKAIYENKISFKEIEQWSQKG
ncbi:MAG: 1-(5-phosphoribosyl)-5-[(5-phosphoribosylamino)methylideneamino]imidazole-4-carboxamide isomerase [Bacteroidales bacterium]|nr:1-(5-phosphoribosyl)-5-[(5-phosphoribosylamino)methylideneamino]imidazole-4-carboxamide isomerase [Bacteroidales bacterium]